MNDRNHLLNYPETEDAAIKTAVQSIIKSPDLFKQIQDLSSPFQNASLSNTLLRIITSDPILCPDKIKQLSDLSEDIQGIIRKKALRTLEQATNNNWSGITNVFRMFNACKDTEQGCNFSIQFFIYQVHYLVNRDFLEVKKKINKLRAQNSKLDPLKYPEQAETILQNNKLISDLIKQNQYTANDFLILYAFYIIFIDYMRATMEKCYKVNKDGKKIYCYSTAYINRLANDLQKALQFNQSFNFNIDATDKITIEERPIEPLSIEEHRRLKTEGKCAWYFKDYFSYTLIEGTNGVTTGGIYDGRYYKIRGRDIAEFQKMLQTANQSPNNSHFTTEINGRALDALQGMADGTKKRKNNFDYLPVNNGILKLDRKSPENSLLLGFTPDIVTTIPIKADYLTEEEYIKVFQSDKYKQIDYYFDYISGRFDEKYKDHYQEIKTRIIESLSTALTRSQEFKLFFFIHGQANTGKTKIIDTVLNGLFDPDYFKQTSFDSLDTGKHFFELAEFENKAIISIDEGGKIGDGRSFSSLNPDNIATTIKILVGGSRIDASVKNQQKKQSFYNESRLYISSNNYFNFEDAATLNKLVYVPMYIDLKKADLTNIFPNIQGDSETRTIFFNYLLRNGLYRVFKNFEEHSYYITPSNYIDGLHQNAKRETNLYKSVIDFIEDESIETKLPCLNNEFYSNSNKEGFSLKYWRELYKSGDWSKLSDNHFNDVFCELLGVRNQPRQKINGKQIALLLPKGFYTYGTYKKHCEELAQQKQSLIRSYRENAEQKAKEVQAELNQIDG